MEKIKKKKKGIKSTVIYMGEGVFS